MDIEVRAIEPKELRAAVEVCSNAFGSPLKDEEWDNWQHVLEADRTWVATSDGSFVGTGSNFTLELTIPGGRTPAAGLTIVGVLPGHRRRGILTRLMDRFLTDARDHEEPVSILWASEPSIYQRYGYGLGSRQITISAERAHMRFLEPAQPRGTVRLVPLTEAADAVAGVHREVAAVTPGMLGRTDAWWKWHRLADPESEREGGSPMWCALLEVAGEATAYALYRIKANWPDGNPRSTVNVLETAALTPADTKELWTYLFGIDLVERIDAWFLPVDHPLPLLVTDPRRLNAKTHDALWLRVVDIPAALSSRGYGGDGSLVLAVHDGHFQDQSGAWALETSEGKASVSRTDADPDIECDVRDLGALYLGGVRPHELALAGRLVARSEGALERLDAMLGTFPAPWAPEIF